MPSDAEFGSSIDFLRSVIRDVPDFPQPGIVFRDVTPLLANREALRRSIDVLADATSVYSPDVVVGIESRGFLFGVPIADRLGTGFVPMRKPGKLPMAVHREAYGLEYGTDVLELHIDAITPGSNVVIVDDVLATGGTAKAACSLVARAGAHVVAVVVLVELAALAGRSQLNAPVVAPIVY